MTDYALSVAGFENEEFRYPIDKPYALREQSARTPEETQLVVLSDIVDILVEMREEYDALVANALQLEAEAEGLDTETEDYFEYLNDIVEQASQLDHVRVEWDGDAGMVHISISDYWYEVEDASND